MEPHDHSSARYPSTIDHPTPAEERGACCGCGVSEGQRHLPGCGQPGARRQPVPEDNLADPLADDLGLPTAGEVARRVDTLEHKLNELEHQARADAAQRRDLAELLDVLSGLRDTLHALEHQVAGMDVRFDVQRQLLATHTQQLNSLVDGGVCWRSLGEENRRDAQEQAKAKERDRADRLERRIAELEEAAQRDRAREQELAERAEAVQLELDRWRHAANVACRGYVITPEVAAEPRHLGQLAQLRNSWHAAALALCRAHLPSVAQRDGDQVTPADLDLLRTRLDAVQGSQLDLERLREALADFDRTNSMVRNRVHNVVKEVLRELGANT